MNKTRIAIIILLLAAVTAVVIVGPGISSVVAAPQETESELEDFVPTEKLPSDSAVAFPVDI